MDLCFVHCHIPMQEIMFMRVNSDKELSESSTRCYFCSIVSKRGTHLEKTFFMPNFSFKIVDALPVDMFTILSISRTFSLRSSITIFKTCLIFSGVAASFGLPERSASFVSVRPRLKSAYYRKIVVFDGAQSG